MEALDVFRRFALSVDIINDNIKKEINHILKDICFNILGANYFEVQIKGSPDSETGIYNTLKTIWSDAKGTTTRIRKDNGDYNGQTSFAFSKNVKLWINDENGNLLDEDSKCVDYWSETKNLPKYWKYKYATSNYKTSVIIPLEYEGVYTPIGILNLEFEKKYDFTKKNQLVFENLAKTLAILTHSYEVRTHQSNNTESALKELQKLVIRKTKILDKATVFVAFPMDCEPDIIKLIYKISKEFTNQYEFIFWDKINRSGSIDKQLIDDITKSKYGIIYFSQKGDNGNYFDNPNVVFEAGMFHAMTSENLSNKPARWIPIRENKSDAKPFDFAHQRIIDIKRNKKTNKIIGIKAIEDTIIERLKEF